MQDILPKKFRIETNSQFIIGTFTVITLILWTSYQKFLLIRTFCLLVYVEFGIISNNFCKQCLRISFWIFLDTHRPPCGVLALLVGDTPIPSKSHLRSFANTPCGVAFPFPLVTFSCAPRGDFASSDFCTQPTQTI